jgi:hypothetical protein
MDLWALPSAFLFGTNRAKAIGGKSLTRDVVVLG